MTTIVKNYRGKPVKLDLEKRNYSVREISEMTNLSISYIRTIFQNCNLKHANYKYCRKAKRTLKVYDYRHLSIAFNQTPVLYPVIKKERKPYFEFAYQSFESKINKL
jgi:hypothetical protein